MASGLLQTKTVKELPTYIQWVSLSPLLITLIVRVLWLHAFPSQPAAPVDAEGYTLLARNLMAGHGFAIAWEGPFCPNTVRTPLYPLFLAFSYILFDVIPQRVVLLHNLLEVLTCAIVIRMGRDFDHLIGGKPWHAILAGSLAGVLYALNGTTQRYTGFLFAETLLLPLLSAAILLTIRALLRPSLLSTSIAGLLWALAVLTKPNVQYLGIGAGLILVWVIIYRIVPLRQKLLSILGFWMVAGLVLLPWVLRNNHITSLWMLSSAFTENTARVAAVATQAEFMGVSAEPWTTTWEHIYENMVMQVSVHAGWLFDIEPRFSCSVAIRRQFEITRAARQLVRQHLPVYLKAHLRGVLKSLIDPGHRLWYFVLTGKEWSTTGVVPDIWTRIAWSLQRKAVWDAVQVFIRERITRIPLFAGMLWWSLVTGRLLCWYLVTKGLWHLRRKLWIMSFLFTILLYIILLPGPIAHDRFTMPAVPVTVTLMALGILSGQQKTPS